MDELTNTGHQTSYACSGCGLKWTRELIGSSPSFALPSGASLKDLVDTARMKGANAITKIAPGEGQIRVELGMGASEEEEIGGRP